MVRIAQSRISLGSFPLALVINRLTSSMTDHWAGTPDDRRSGPRRPQPALCCIAVGFPQSGGMPGAQRRGAECFRVRTHADLPSAQVRRRYPESRFAEAEALGLEGVA